METSVVVISPAKADLLVPDCRVGRPVAYPADHPPLIGWRPATGPVAVVAL